MFNGCAQEIKTFDVTGSVKCEGEAIVGARVGADVLSEPILTDDEGNFEITGLTDTTSVSVEADGYFVTPSSQFASETNNHLDFVAYKYYDLSGQVKSHNVGIGGVQVSAIGLVNKNAITDDLGYFTIRNLAGIAYLTAQKSGYLFEEKQASINNSDIVFNGTTSISASIFDFAQASQVHIAVDDKTMQYVDNKFIASDVDLGSVVVPSMDGYYFEPSAVTVVRENQNIVFTAYPLYSVSGVVKCGNVTLPDITVTIGEHSTTTDLLGEFCIDGVYGETVANFEDALGVYEFTNLAVTREQNILEAQGSFVFAGSIVNSDTRLGLANIDILSGDKHTIANEAGKFKLTGVHYGDIITFASDEYKLQDYQITANVYSAIFEAQKYYNATIYVTCDNQPISSAVIKMGEQEYFADARGVIEIANLLDTYTDVTVSAEGYKSEVITISPTDNNKNLSLLEYYDINVIIHSGQDIILSDATFKLNDEAFSVDTSGRCVLQNQVGEFIASAQRDGYNAITNVVINKYNCDIDFDLEYQVTGAICSGDTSLANLEVIIYDIVDSLKVVIASTYTDDDGRYALTTKGMHYLAVADTTAQYYLDGEETEISIVVISQNVTVDFCSKYTVSGTLTDEEGVVMPNVTICLDGEETSVRTDDFGKYYIIDLQGEHILSTSDAGLKPSYYSILRGGIYDFSKKGYSISGRVTSGGIGVPNVIISTSLGIEATTDALGEYTFPLLTGMCTITASKEGYTFSDPIEVLAESADVDFTATYSVVGRVHSGVAMLDGVVVTLTQKDDTSVTQTFTTNEAGTFEFAGLDKQYIITFAKDGYQIDSQEVEQYTALDIVAYAMVNVEVKLGTTPLAQVNINTSQHTFVTDETGQCVALVESGDSLHFAIIGYDFAVNDIVISEPSDINVLANYSITGAVKSVTQKLSGVAVYYGDKVVYTDENGLFAIAGLDTEYTLIFEMSGYHFEQVFINRAQELNINPTEFMVQGNVTLDGIGLAGVSITDGEHSVITDENGYYSFYTANSGVVIASNDGYEFSTTKSSFRDYATINFVASFALTLNIKSGDVTINRDTVSISIENNNSAEVTNLAGMFVVTGLTKSGKLIITATGYNDYEYEFAGFMANIIDIDMSYDISIILNENLTDYSITYSVYNMSQNTITYSGQTFTLENIVGNATVVYSKDGYKFMRNGTYYADMLITFTKARKEVNISIVQVYSVSGTATFTNNGVTTPLIGAIISVGNNSTSVDQDGHYILNGLVGQNTVSCTLPAFSGLNAITVDSRVASTPVNNFDFNYTNNKYMLWLALNGYDLTQKSAGYTLTTTGVVHPSMGGDQNVYSMKQKDNQNRYYIENNNLGSEVAGIDPSVALTAYYDQNSDVVAYHQTKDVVKDADNHAKTSNYSAGTWVDSNYSGFTGTYGTSPNGLYAYIITSDTVSGYSNFASTGDGYTFTISLNTSTSVVNYKKQMNKLSGQNATFDSINLTYTLDKNGYIKQITTEEKYKVSVIITINITANLTETYQITDGTESCRDKILSASYNLPDAIVAKI